MSIFHDQDKFLQAGDVEKFTLEAEKLANTLIAEEYLELQEEAFFFNDQDPTDTIKEALDLIYVTAQYLNVTIGPDKAKECWDALQENNMSKCVDGKLVKREDGKILKPEGYKKLDLGELLDGTL
jgi:predicted HAD superfamily Cof-like phosphohydrolase